MPKKLRRTRVHVGYKAFTFLNSGTTGGEIACSVSGSLVRFRQNGHEVAVNISQLDRFKQLVAELGPAYAYI